MFNSLNGGYVAISIATIIAAWFISGVRSIVLRVVLALVVPVAISLVWYFVPATITDRGEGWIGWGIIAAGTWSIVAVPIGVAATLGLSLIRNHRSGGR